MEETVTISRKMSQTELWSSIMGSLEFHFEWWLSVKYLDGADWDKPGAVQIAILNEDNKKLIKTLTIDDLVQAYEFVVNKPYYHCGTEVDIDNMDECSSDMVLQVAMLGDVVYG